MINFKKVILVAIFALSSFVPTPSYSCCYTITCDPEVVGIMGQHRSKLNTRMNDILQSINALTNSFRKMNSICLLENIELVKLKARTRIIQFEQKAINHESQNLKMSTSPIIK